MTTYTSGTSATTYQPFITGAGQLSSNFDPLNDFGYGPASPNGNVYFHVTAISGKAKGYDGTSTVTMFIGGTSTTPYSVGTSSTGGTSATTSAYVTTGGSVNTVVREGTTFYVGYDTNSAGGLYTTRSTGDTGKSVYASGSASFTSSAVYGVVTYYAMPDTAGTLSISSAGSGSVYVTVPSTSGADGYRVQYSSNGVNWADSSLSGSGTISGLSLNTTYYFRHAAYRSGAYAISVAYTGPYSPTQTFYVAPAVSWSGSFSTYRVGEYNNSGVTATGSGGAITLTGGSVPPGTSGYVSGESYYVSGTPTASGTYNLTLDSQGVTYNPSITVYTPNVPYFNSTTFVTGKDGSAYGSSSITATYTSGLQNITTNVSTIAGLSISTGTNSVTLSGTPNQAGNFSFNATAYGYTDNGVPNTVTTTLYVTITAKTPPTWTDSIILNTFVVGTQYTDSVSATNSPTYSVYSGALPTGIALNSSTGALTGTPTTKQVYSFTLRATNTDGFVEVSYSGTTTAAPVWVDQTIGDFLQGRAYSDSVSASQTPTYSISAGALPVGITFTNGSFTGTPTGSGAYTFTVRASNADGAITKEFTGSIKLVPNWTKNTLSSFVETVEYADTVTATNSPTYSISAGALPTGISLNSATGAVTGTPTVLGENYSFTITATNADGTVSQSFSGTVAQDLGGGIKIFDGTNWVNKAAYAYDVDTWKEGKVYVYNGTIWVKSLF